jgi:hypothetical protein
MKQVLVLVLTLLSALSLCAQQEKTEVKSATEATVGSATSTDEASSALVFYRPKRFTGSGLTPSVYVNGEQVARLDNGRYFVVKLKPGTYKIESSMKHDPLELEVKAGKQQFLEMVILAGNWRGGGRFIPTGESDAREALKKLKALDQKWVTSKNVSLDLPEESAAGK